MTISVARRVVDAARLHGLRLATAESLTGGLLAAALVDTPGASRVFLGGVISYDTALKQSMLGVDGPLLAKRGPVHPEVARQMAKGVRLACATQAPADIGVSTTGVAGPGADPATGQPVGTVWVGVSSHRGERAVELHLSGERDEVRLATVAAALDALLDEIERIA